MIIVIIFGLSLKDNNALAGVDPAVDHTFNYQGELLNSNNPVNGLYDFTIEAYTSDSGNGVLGMPFERIKVPVTNGIFTISDIDLGDVIDGFAVYLEISVRENGVGAAYETLLPRTKINSVPYATKLISGNAQQDQVLTFSNGEWGPQDLPAGQNNSPWIVTGTKINYDAGNVGIGIGNESHIYKLQVKATDRNTASFDGADNNTVVFKENGNTRGLIGSGNNIGADDFSIATPVAGTGKIHLAPEVNPVLTVTPAEFVGIGIQNPTSTLHVKNDEVLTAQFDGGVGSSITLLEQGVARGFIGSISSVADTDLAVGTVAGDLHLISGLFGSPSVTVKVTGDIGINTISPQADFHVEGTVGGDLLRVRIDGVTKLRVRENGGTAIGAAINPPINGLIVAGNVQQSLNSNGMMKYMASIVNCGNANVSINKSYNGVDTGAITPQNDVAGIGTCEILFTTNISNRYIMATETSGIAATGNVVSCSHLGNNGISCVVSNSAGNETPGNVDLLIF